jgi:hypothetical protein
MQRFGAGPMQRLDHGIDREKKAEPMQLKPHLWKLKPFSGTPQNDR